MSAGSILLIAFISVSLGYAAGLILTRKNMQPKAPAPVRADGSGPRFEVNRLSVTLWSKTAHGPLIADLHGKSYASRDEVPEIEKKKLFNEIQITEAWFGLIPQPAVEKVNEIESPETDESAEASQVENIIPAESPAAISPVEEMAPPAEPTADAVPPVQKEVEFIQALAQEPVVPVPARLDTPAKITHGEPKSIVEQINDILQVKVKTSSFADEGLKLQETPSGVLVWVGKASYQGVDALPAGEARKMIQEAVKEWESR